MNARCPRCSRATDLEDDVGDFPTHCHKCGALIRRSPRKGAEPGDAGGMEPEGPVMQRGALAGMLARSEGEPRIISHLGTPAAEPAEQGVLRPETRREVARAAARYKALRRAELRGSHQALGALGWAGMTLVLLLAIGAMVLKAQAMLQHPMPTRADTLTAAP